MRYYILGSHRGQPDRTNNILARGLGVFSLLLGTLELLMADRLAHALGLDGYTWVISAYGVREALTGLVVLFFKDAAPGIWLRVLGDGLDLATLIWGFMREPADRTNILLAGLIVSPIVLFDIFCALRFKRSSVQPLEPIGTPA